MTSMSCPLFENYFAVNIQAIVSNDWLRRPIYCSTFFFTPQQLIYVLGTSVPLSWGLWLSFLFLESQLRTVRLWAFHQTGNFNLRYAFSKGLRPRLRKMIMWHYSFEGPVMRTLPLIIIPEYRMYCVGIMSMMTPLLMNFAQCCGVMKRDDLGTSFRK